MEKIKNKVKLIKESEKSYTVEFQEGEFKGVKEAMPKKTSNISGDFLETSKWAWDKKTEDFRNGKFFLKQDQSKETTRTSDSLSKRSLKDIATNLESITQELKNY